MPRPKRKRTAASRVNVGGQPMAVDALRGPDPKFKPVSLANAKEGWRAWSVSRDMPKFGLPPKLRSVTHSAYHWPAKRKAEALCESCGKDVPGVDCSCGFYSAKSLRHLMQMGYHTYADIDETKSFKVVGQVACWGKVIEGTQGWRTQYAYPTYLMVPFEVGAEFVAPLRNAYGCQVRLLNFLVHPSEITDEFLEGLMAGKAPARQIPKQARHGRRVSHKQMRFTGRTVSDPYDKNGKRVVDVIWDIRPLATVSIDQQQLDYEAV
jgi:hypothetical protein